MLSFYLIGINVVDLCRLNAIEDDRIEYVRAKTGKRYSIKIWPEAMPIIEKYGGRSQLLYMLDEYGDYRKFYQCYENGLRKIAGILGIPSLTSYHCRHSWATIASEIDIPKETIAAALGHELGNSTTSIYIDYDIKKVDAANRKVIDYVINTKK